MWSKGSQNDYLLYSASRRSDAVVAFDMRMLTGDSSHPIQGVASYARDSDTNQRLEFDFDSDGKRMFVGSQDCSVKVYDTWTGKLVDSIEGFDDAVNGVSFSSQNDRFFIGVQYLILNSLKPFENLILREREPDSKPMFSHRMYSLSRERVPLALILSPSLQQTIMNL